jgi:hypothetical protein
MFFLKKPFAYTKLHSPFPPSQIYMVISMKEEEEEKHEFNGEIYCSHVLYNVFLYLEVLYIYI